MTAPRGWHRIGAEHPGDLILCVDFDTVGRADASFLDLVPLLPVEAEAWQVDLPVPAPAIGATAEPYLTPWSEGVLASGRTVAAVLGFCAGAGYAAALAERIAGTGAAAPRLVLLDPERPTLDTLARQYEVAVAGLSAVLTAEDRATLHTPRPTGTAGADALAPFGEALAAAYRQVGAVAFARIGLRENLRRDLVGAFDALMAYLVAAGTMPPAATWAAGTAVVSADAVDDAPGSRGRIRIGVPHGDLLRSGETARVVRRLLGAGVGPDPAGAAEPVPAAPVASLGGAS